MPNQKTWIARARMLPRDYQVDDTRKLVDQKRVGLFLGVGGGKSKVCVDGSQLLFEDNVIDTVLVIGPGCIVPVWADPELGQITAHQWIDVPQRVQVYGADHRKLKTFQPATLEWIVTNLEFIRYGCKTRGKRMPDGTRFNFGPNLDALVKALAGRRVLLIIDEAWAISSASALQTKAMLRVAKLATAVAVLNGTPADGSPLDLFSQMAMISPRILDCPNELVFKRRYAIETTNRGFPEIVGWQNLEDLQKRCAPHVVYRKSEDMLSLSPLVESVLPVPLTMKTWIHYRELRDEMITQLGNNTIVTTSNALTRALRLAQILAGFVGGVEALDDQQEIDFGAADPIGSEKNDAILDYLDGWLRQTTIPKAVIWVRFDVQQDRLVSALRERLPHVTIGEVRGNQKAAEREAAVRLLWPGMHAGPAIVVAKTAAGGAALNFGGASLEVFLTNDFILRARNQARGRVEPRAAHPVTLLDVVATGPGGQKTADHTVLTALKNKLNLADFMTAAWRAALQNECVDNPF